MQSTKLSPLMKKTMINVALAVTFGSAALSAQAANLNTGDTLTITAGVAVYDSNGNFTNVSSGSWFGMDTNKNSIMVGTEKTAVSQGSTGLVIGVTTSAGASHVGNICTGVGVPVIAGYVCPGADANAITAPWEFFGNTGSDYVTTAVTGGTGGLNMSGWTVTWNGIAAIPMGNTAWGAGYSNGVGNLVWGGTYGHTYTLDYHGTVPVGDVSGFGGVQYALHLEGTVISGTEVLASMTSPSGNAVDAATTHTITVTFPEPVTGVTTGYISINGGTVPVNSVSASGNTYTFNIGALANGTTYTVVFNNAAIAGGTGLAVSGKPLANVPNATFTTSIPDATPPTVLSTTPSAGASIGTNTSTIVVTFSEAMNVSTVTTTSLTTSPPITISSVTPPLGGSGDKIFTFNISGLAASTNYTVSVNSQAKDVAGNSVQNVAGNSWSFSTLSGANPLLAKATNDRLLICSGSKFGMYVSPSNPIFTSITQKNPIAIGVAQPASNANHTGALTGSEATVIDKAWEFFGSTGYHFSDTPVTDNGNGTMDFSGWRVGWNQVSSIYMGSGAPAVFTWDGVYGHNYTLSYETKVPNGDPSGFGGVRYTLSLTGKVLGGPSNVIAVCDGAVVSPSGVAVSITGGGSIALNSQLRPDDTDVRAAGYSTAGRPDNLDFYKYGLITYTVTGLAQGATAAVTLTLPTTIPAGTRVYKVGRNGYTDITSQVTISGSDILLNIQDDGPLDACKLATGCAVGVIVDPIAVGIPIATGSSGDASGAGGGGCAYNPNSKFDFGMLLALFGSLAYLGWRRTRQ